MAECEEFIFLSYQEVVGMPELTEEIDGNADEEGYIYIIEEVDPKSTDTTNYKVGRAVNPRKRLFDLQTGNTRKLQILNPQTKVKNMREAENALHNALSSYRCQLGGGTEWFTVPLGQKRTFLATCRRILAPYQA